jgi:hypothetical protein
VAVLGPGRSGETRTCWACGKIGHILTHCSDQKTREEYTAQHSRHTRTPAAAMTPGGKGRGGNGKGTCAFCDAAASSQKPTTTTARTSLPPRVFAPWTLLCSKAAPVSDPPQFRARTPCRGFQSDPSQPIQHEAFPFPHEWVQVEIRLLL